MPVPDHADGLQLIGAPAPLAISTSITFRLLTIYLPPLSTTQAMR